MLKEISIKNGIKHTDATFKFEKGVTAIKGQNGAGKSLIQEFIRFALFGSKALRGKISDYSKDLKVRMVFSIRDEDYVVERKLTECNVIREKDGRSITGTTACNEFIIKLFGYNLNIFDMGNCAKQGEVSSLGKMTPQERKNAIDKLLGLSAIDKLIKEIKEQQIKVKGRLEAYENSLIELKEPELKEEIGFSERELEELIEKSKQRENIEFALSNIPQVEEMKEPVGSLSLAIEKEKLLSSLPEKEDFVCEYSLEDLKKEKRNAYEWFLFNSKTKGEEPSITEDECKKYKEEWEKYLKYVSATKVECPNCGHKFAKLGESVLEVVEEPKCISGTELSHQIDLIKLWKTKPECEKPIGIKNCDSLISKIEQADRINEKRKFILDKLKDIKTSSSDEWRKYNFYVETNRKREDLLNKLNIYKCDFSSSYLQKELDKVRYNKRETERYNELKLRNETTQKAITENESLFEEYNKEIKGLKKVKDSVKTLTLPEIGKIATSLVREMSNECINEIAIDDSFSILVDGKDVCLFSESEKDLINLSLRFALGCVLTHKVFNVFLGDEIDASMSEERALLVSKALCKIKGKIEQIILISHRNIEADNFINL